MNTFKNNQTHWPSNANRISPILLVLVSTFLFTGCCDLWKALGLRDSCPIPCHADTVQVSINLSNLQIACVGGANCLKEFNERDTLLVHQLNGIEASGPNTCFCKDDPFFMGIAIPRNCVLANPPSCHEPPGCPGCFSYQDGQHIPSKNMYPTTYANLSSWTVNSNELVVFDCEGDSIIPSHEPNSASGTTDGFLTISVINLADYEGTSFLTNSGNVDFVSVEEHYRKRWGMTPISDTIAPSDGIHNLDCTGNIDSTDNCGVDPDLPMIWGLFSGSISMHSPSTNFFRVGPQDPPWTEGDLNSACPNFGPGVNYFTIYNCNTKIFVTIIETEVEGSYIRLGYDDCSKVSTHISLVPGI